MDQWENRFRQAFEEFEPAVSEDLWQDVLRKRQRRQGAAPFLSWRVAASMAMLLTAGAIAWHLNRITQQTALETGSEAPTTSAEGPYRKLPDQGQETVYTGTAGMDRQPSDTALAGAPARSLASTGSRGAHSGSAAGHRVMASKEAADPSEKVPDASPVALATLVRPVVPITRLASAEPVLRAVEPLEDLPETTRRWAMLRRLPLFQTSDKTLPERTADTWAILDPEGFQHIRNLAEKPTTIEIIW